MHNPQNDSLDSPISRVHVVRFTLDSAVLPPATETLMVAERTRIALMGRYKLQKLSRILGRPVRRNAEIPADAPRVRSEAFSGKTARNTPLDGHQHAFYLPTDEDRDGRIDHLTVLAEMGFDDVELDSLNRLRTVRYANGDPLRLLLLGLGQRDQLRAPPLARSDVWVSVTPFIATRHPKKNGRRRDPPDLLNSPVKFVQAVLREELGRWIARKSDLQPLRPQDVTIEPLVDPHDVFHVPVDPSSMRPTGPGRRAPFESEPGTIRLTQFKRSRSKQHDDGGRRRCGAFQIRFPHPVSGPLCLGVHSHFGMGLFLPQRESDL